MTLKSNDAESSALITAGINYILIHIEKENSYFLISVMSNSFFTILLFYWILNQINAALVSISIKL